MGESVLEVETKYSQHMNCDILRFTSVVLCYGIPGVSLITQVQFTGRGVMASLIGKHLRQARKWR